MRDLGLLRGTVRQVTPTGPRVEIPTIARGYLSPPLQTLAGVTVAPDDRVTVGRVGEYRDDLIVLGRTSTGTGGAGGGGFATLVAAENAPAALAERADHVVTAADAVDRLQQLADDRIPIAVVGNVPLDGPVNLTERGFHIAGYGPGLSGLRAADGQDDWLLRIDGGDAAIWGTVTGLYLDCNSGGSAGGGINASYATDCEFSQLLVRNPTTVGIRLAGEVGGAEGFGHQNRVSDCLFDATIDTAGDGYGLLLTSSDENVVTGCRFQFMGSTAGQSTMIRDVVGLNLFTDCTFVGGRNNCRGITIRDTPPNAPSRVSGCVFDGVSGDNVFLTGRAHRVTDCTFTSVGDQGTAGQASGVLLEFAAGQNTVTGCSFSSAAAAGQTRSFVREEGSGDPELNRAHGNSGWIVGSLSHAPYALSGAGSAAFNNVGLAGDDADTLAYYVSIGLAAA